MSLVRYLTKTKFWLLPLFFVFLTGIFLRIKDVQQESIWLDEAFSLFMAHFDPGTIVAATAADNHPPLYYLLLHAWIRFFGDSPFASRFPSFVFGVALLILVYLIGKELFSKKVGILSLLFAAFSPLLVWYSQETRSYAMLAFFSLLSFYSMYQGILAKKKAYWVLFCFSSIVMLYTHYFSLFFLFVEAIVFFLVWERDAKTFLHAFGSSVLILLFYVPWMIILVQKGGDPSALSWAVVNEHTWKLTILQLVGGNPDGSLLAWNKPTFFESIALVFVPVVFLSGVVISVRRKEWKKYLSTLLFAFLPAAIAYAITLTYAPIYHTRFFIYSVPFLFFGIAYSLANVHSLFPRNRKHAPLLMLSFIILLIGGGLVAVLMAETHIFLEERLDKEDWRGVSDYLKKNSQPEDLVLTEPRYYMIPLSYYFEKKTFIGHFAYDTAGGKADVYGNDIFLNAYIGPLLEQLTENRIRIWLVSPYWSQGEIKQWLEQRRGKGEEQNFSEVQLILYQKV